MSLRAMLPSSLGKDSVRGRNKPLACVRTGDRVMGTFRVFYALAPNLECLKNFPDDGRLVNGERRGHVTNKTSQTRR